MRYAMLAVAMALAGCVNKPITGRADPYSPEQIHFTEADLANKTAVGPPLVERRDGLLHVTVPIRSAINKALHIDYRVTFLDKQGVPVEGPGTWNGGTVLPPNTPSFIRTNSMTANAADFQIDIRWAE